MAIIPEETLLRYLRTCIDMSSRALEEMSSSRATESLSPELLSNYSELIQDLHGEKRNDSTLADESWEWIWKIKPNLNSIQLYGRLAWINYNLLDLL